MLLAPFKCAASRFFNHVQTDSRRHAALLAEMQRLRGRLYLQDSAIEPWQLTEGRHQLDSDSSSWHLLVKDAEDRICGCIRYREHSSETQFSQLGVATSALANCHDWGGRLRAAIEGELALSRRLELPYVEVGGWALAPEIRGSAEAVRMSLAMFGLSQALGGAVGMSTVTRRNCSASILRRIGGRSLETKGLELPSYYDAQYKCEMEVLRFYSWAPNPRYNLWINELRTQFQSIPVLTDGAKGPSWLRSTRDSRPASTWSNLPRTLAGCNEVSFVPANA
jgi:hypothetical protein